MQSEKQTLTSTTHVQQGEFLDRSLGPTTGRRIQPDRGPEGRNDAIRRGPRALETPSQFSERLGYRRPSEADVMRRYAGRCYADDARANRDRYIGARATPMPNLGASLTGNAAAMCSGA